jgi:hypothetical protein
MKFFATVVLALAAAEFQVFAMPVETRQLGSGFVTEACTNDSQCQQGCCAFSTGKCAGPDVAQSNGDGGCGFGDAAPNCDVATALGFTNCIAGAQRGTLTASQIQTAAEFVAQLDGITHAITPPTTPPSGGAAAPAAPAPANNAGSGTAATTSSSSAALGSQFVTGACTSDTDCQQGCCAFATGKCAGPDVAQSNGDGGCGFGTAQPNCQVASALGFSNCIAGGTTTGVLSQSQLQTAVLFVANLDGLAVPAGF